MAADAVKSLSITNLDAIPSIPNSRGQGAPGMLQYADGVCAATATGVGTLVSTYRLCRIPTGAIPKSVVFATDKALDSNASQVLAFDLNLVFSDSTLDGTPSNVQGLIPTTANTGATTTFAAYSSPNIIFGTVVNASHTAALGPTDVIFSGSRTNYPLINLTQQPLWQTFGFVDGRGNPVDPNGYFDLVAYVSTAAATGVAGNIYARVGYVY